jgi:uncharacterized protein
MSEHDWTSELEETGHGLIAGLVDAEECARLAALYDEPGRFRSRVIMARHGFGRGEYQYFDHPLPRRIRTLRSSLYTALAPVANRWMESLGESHRYPASLETYLETCHALGQTRPTPLLLRYGPGDFNCLHQDLYGAEAFPFQVTVLLSRPELDFTGGEFVLTQQRPRMQSRVEVVPLGQGDAVVFAVNERPVRGSRGIYRVRMRHGVSEVRSGRRHTLGIIFHDAE